jgi:hypothetical protein
MLNHLCPSHIAESKLYGNAANKYPCQNKLKQRKSSNMWPSQKEQSDSISNDIHDCQQTNNNHTDRMDINDLRVRFSIADQ